MNRRRSRRQSGKEARRSDEVRSVPARPCPAEEGAGADRRARPRSGEFGASRFANRELSWLDFGERLLDLAEDASIPVLERVKFVAIFSEALDEFFQVRVAGLKDQVDAGLRTRSSDGLRPSETLAAIKVRVDALVERQSSIFLDQIVPTLADAGVRLSDWASLDDDDREYLVEVFQRQIFPVLTPLAVDPGHPFPYISNLSLNLLLRVGDPVSGEERVARVKVPPLLPRFIVMPDNERFVPLEQVIAAHLGTLFPDMTIGAHYVFRVTRNADLSLEEDEADDLLAAVELELRRRRFGRSVRLELEEGASSEIRELLLRELDLDATDLYTTLAPLDLSGLFAVADLDRPDLRVEAWAPMTPGHSPTRETSRPTCSRSFASATCSSTIPMTRSPPRWRRSLRRRPPIRRF